jgi:hypothetical protein
MAQDGKASVARNRDPSHSRILAFHEGYVRTNHALAGFELPDAQRQPKSACNNVTSRSNRHSLSINTHHSPRKSIANRAIRNHGESYKANTRNPNQSPTFCYFSAPVFRT